MSLFATVAVAALTALFTGLTTAAVQERRLRAELRTEFMAEQAAKQLLESPQWEKRSFEAIRRRLRGFDDDELRKILVRAGAVCFEGASELELWGLLSRNKSST